MPLSLTALRRFTVGRNFPEVTTLGGALERMGFVQADPIRAPARAQDLTLRHRVAGYRAGDLERRYAELGLEEDFFVTYGFVTRRLQALMQPRADSRVPADAALPWPAARKRRAALLLAFVRERGTVHPRDVDAHFAHGTVRNYWGGSSNATTHLLDAMHYQGMLRVVRRENGIRLYAAHEHAPAPADPELCRHRLDALVDAAVGIYAPLTGTGLASFVRRLRFAAPQWTRQLPAALKRAKQRLAHERVEGIDWYWPAGESAGRHEPPDAARLLTPFDPVTRDRGRFELLWGWVYRFEAYTPKRKRKLGYYALPLLWRDRVIGWGNASVENGRLEISLGYVAGRPPRERAFRREIEAERARLAAFLSLES